MQPKVIEVKRETNWRPPWSILPDGWDIAIMNHYHVEGVRYLFVGITKGNVSIKEEGLDDEYLWNRLRNQAVDFDEYR